MKNIFVIIVLAGILWAGCDRKVVYPPIGLPGAKGSVYALSTYNGNLITGGHFSSIGSVSANNIAQWNGTTWADVGFPASDSIKKLTTYNGNLIASGFNGTIYEWNGSVWSTLLSDNSKAIDAIMTYNGNLIAGGRVINSEAAFLQEWNGSNWTSMGSFPTTIYPFHNNYVLCLENYNGNLIAAGTFDSINGISLKNIAQWNGSVWSSVGGGAGTNSSPYITEIFAMCVYNGNLIVGGYVGQNGSQNLGNLAQWNGANWQAINSGIVNPVYPTVIYNGNVVSAGDMNEVYQWNGTSSTRIGVNCDPTDSNTWVNAMQVYGGNLYIAGYFTSVNGNPAYNIAQYNGSIWSPL